MYLILIVVVLVFAFYFIILKPGRLDFWKFANKHKDLAFEMFKKRDCWHIFMERPEGGYENALSPGEWDGPFMFIVPKLGGKVITVYGRVPDYHRAQQEFIDGIK